MQRAGEVIAEAVAAVAEDSETEPVLLDLFELVPTGHQLRIKLATRSLIPQKAQIFQDVLVQGLILGLVTMKQQERIDK